MRAVVLSMAGAAVLVLVGSATSFASDVNCGIVMKSVKMGRSAQDIADTMMISTSDVEKCKKEAAEKPAADTGKTEKPADKKPEGAGDMH